MVSIFVIKKVCVMDKVYNIKEIFNNILVRTKVLREKKYKIDSII